MAPTRTHSPVKLAGMVLGAALAVVPVACSDAESDETSMTSMASDTAIGESFVATYFNAERFEDGADADWPGGDAELAASWDVGRPEVLLGEPFVTAAQLNRPDILLFDLADVDANYDTVIGGGDVSVWVGDFDPGAVDERAAVVEDDGDVIEQRSVSQSRDVTDERYVHLGSDVDVDDVVGVDTADSALAIDGVEEITAVLDDHDAYAAALVLRGPSGDVTFSGDATLAAGWEVGGLAAGFENGDHGVSTALWHLTDEDAQANAAALPAVMSAHAGCDEPAEVDVDDLLVYASCPTERAMWASVVLEQVGEFPPLFGTTDDS